MEEAEAEDELGIGLRLLTVRKHAVVTLHHGTSETKRKAFVKEMKKKSSLKELFHSFIHFIHFIAFLQTFFKR